MRVGSTPPSPLPAEGPCGGDGGGALGGEPPGSRTGVGRTGLMPLLEKAERDVTNNMLRIIGRTG
jgi:hypothetical protein